MRVHIVQKGDTLWKIAKQYSIGFEDLKRLNAHLANPDYIVPGMEIILPDGGTKKEKEVVQKPAVKEQEKVVKPIVKEKPIVPTPKPMPTPTPIPVPLPTPIQQRPLWQGDFYYQPPAVPVQIPNWQQTHVHFQPTIEAPIMTPAPQPVPLPPPPPPATTPTPPAIMPPPPQLIPQQPIYIQPPPMHHHCMPPMHHHCMPHCMPPMQQHCMPPMMPPMPVCQKCHGIRMDDSPAFMPMYQEESPLAPIEQSQDRDQQVRHYYDEMQNMNPMMQPMYTSMPMPMMNPCGCQEPPMMHNPCGCQQQPPMHNSCGCQQPFMPYPTPYPMPYPMPQMNPMPHPPKSCH